MSANKKLNTKKNNSPALTIPQDVADLLIDVIRSVTQPAPAAASKPNSVAKTISCYKPKGHFKESPPERPLTGMQKRRRSCNDKLLFFVSDFLIDNRRLPNHLELMTIGGCSSKTATRFFEQLSKGLE